MDGRIDADAPLDYATIQIIPNQNRFEAFVCGDNEVEKLAVGILDHLLPHLPGVSKLSAKGANANFKLQVAGEGKNAAWFTKLTLQRFLQIVGSPDLINKSKAIEGEMSQLQEARKFHLSLYSQGIQDNFESEETDGCNSVETTPKLKGDAGSALTDASKNELLRAMDVRLTALRGELAAALDQEVGTLCSSKEIADLVDFSDNFGAKDLKASLIRILELRQKSGISVPSNERHPSALVSRVDSINQTDGSAQVSRSPHAVTPVKYGVPPSKVAQVERQSSTDGDESSSDSSDDYRAPAERSRTLTRSAGPRRSASPMRRIQIGKAGSRRAAAIGIKSLNYYPGRERLSSNRDVAANSSEDEGTEQHSKKPECNVRRMSVQDAISLFENKQKYQTADPQKKSSSSISLITNKSVLRRWSSGVLESSIPCQRELISGDSTPLPCDDPEDKEISKNSAEHKLESDFTSRSENPAVTNKVDGESETQENGAHDPANNVTEINTPHEQESNGKLTASAEWSRQKEVELNQMLMKMMECQPLKARKPKTSAPQNTSLEQRGGFYNQYKEKRDKKLRGENNEKKAEKDAQIRAMQKILDERKAEMVSSSAKDARVGKTQPLQKPQKPQRSLSQPKESRSASPKAPVTKKVSSKTSTLHATRKSWPSAPSTRTAVSSPCKTPAGISPAVTNPKSRKPQSTPSVPRSSAKVEKPQPRLRNVKETLNDANKSLKNVKEKKQQAVTKDGKTTKIKTAAAAGDVSGIVSSKPNFYNKGTKKSSVVPLETKPFLRKGSGNSPNVNATVNKIKHSPQLEEESANIEIVIETHDNDVALNNSVLVELQDEKEILLMGQFDAAVESDASPSSNHSCERTENVDELAVAIDVLKDTEQASAEIQSQDESGIPPTAWVEIEDHQDLSKSFENGTTQLSSPVRAAPVGFSSVRHSLSQMLLEDNNSESDTAEWGNAENPPAVAYQKDAPKGLKRLLKFARKSKGDANATGWSSPSVFSEGEDDSEESKAFSKRRTENLLRKAAIRSKDHGQLNNSLFEGYEKDMGAHHLHSAEGNSGKFNVQNTHKLRQSSTAACTTKGTRSFFSLSAFRGSKPNDTKFQ